MRSFNFVKPGFVVKIGSDCWIGEGALITGGVTINDGAVILANAVVTKDVPAYAIVGGIPAKIIKFRYSDTDINYLIRLQWWNKSLEWIKKNKDALCDFALLKEKLKNEK